MGYRPQLETYTPPGFVDTPFVRPVSLPLDPAAVIPPGGFLNSYAITLDNDAPQIFRSLFVQGGQQGQNLNIQMQLRGADGKYITDGYVPLWLYAWGAGVTPPDGGSGRAKVFEPELYCPKGSTILADFFNPAGGTNFGAFSLPSLMSVSHTAVQMEGHFVGGQGQGANVFSFGGALYQVLQFVGPPFPVGFGAINVYKSINNGLTWTILDGANGPTKDALFPEPQAGCYFDGVSTITIASTLGSVTDATSAPIVLQDFNLVTGTWGAHYGAGSGNVYAMNQVFKRSDGSVLVITIDSLPAGPMTAHVLAGGVWSSFSLSTLFPGGWVANNMSSPVYDPLTGTIHMFGIAFVGGVTKKQYYQQILLSNSVSGFQDLTGMYDAATAMGDPLLLNGQILWGVSDVTRSFSTIIVGSPLSAPVFSVAPSPGVNPSQPIPYGINPNTLQPTLATDGNTVWAVVCDNRNGAGPGRVWLSSTQNVGNPLIGWTGGVIYDDMGALHPLSGQFQYPTISRQGNQILITFQNSTGQPTNYFMQASVIATLPYMEFRGIKRTRCVT